LEFLVPLLALAGAVQEKPGIKDTRIGGIVSRRGIARNQDNLDAKRGFFRFEDMTASLSSAGRYYQENRPPAASPAATTPQPADNSNRVDPAHVVLRWIPGRNAISHRVFLGPGKLPAFREEMPRTQYEPGPLSSGTTYFWRVDELTPSGIIIGPTWRFTTEGQAEQASESPVSWTQAMDQPAAWFGSPEAARISDNLLLYQRRTGGWPKNIDMAVPLTAESRSRLTSEKDLTDSTIDNNATTARFVSSPACLSHPGRSDFVRAHLQASNICWQPNTRTAAGRSIFRCAPITRATSPLTTMP
jgi:hypothetical protein